MASRVYIVSDTNEPDETPPRLIRATFEDSAVRHVARGRYVAHVASKDELEQWLTHGVKVEYAEGAQQLPLPAMNT